jgi:hypothetical protein
MPFTQAQLTTDLERTYFHLWNAVFIAHADENPVFPLWEVDVMFKRQVFVHVL